ncbi:MAG: hypothetical protein JST79_11805 [Acidobacteria bacterium]|nr:hypothetical protein [Acidobacteriota bacterium]
MKKTFATIMLLLAVASGLFAADKFYADDPLLKEPSPRDAAKVKNRKLNDYYDLLENSFQKRGERNEKGVMIRARDVNTLDEPMDGAWYTHRHYWHAMTDEQLQLGAGGQNPPSQEGQWTIVSAKSEGVTPGFVIVDAKNDKYYVKFDPMKYPELATGAEMISARLFHALGYHVPDYYLIHFTPQKLVLGKDVVFHDAEGRKRDMTQSDLDQLLAKVPRAGDGSYRAIVSLQIQGKPVGPYKYFGVRGDDPNDIVPHEHRRELRGLDIFAAWLQHNDSRSINSLDTLVQENGVTYVRHHLMDFGSTLGSLSTWAKTARYGGEYYLDFKPAPKQIFTLGLAVPYWAHAQYPGYPAIGGFEAATFRPDEWVPDYPNAAFQNRLPDDDFWAAKQVMAFTNQQIRAIVKVAQFSDPRAEQYMAETLIARRDKIGKAFLGKVLPLDLFAVENGQLTFHDLAREHGLDVKGELHITWASFDNKTSQSTPVPGAADFRVPATQGGEVSYLAAHLWRGDDTAKAITVYLRSTGGPTEVVGIDRTW